jgi:threonyl-tRNA synthetase
MWMLIENFAWIFPLWLAPRQAIIVPVMPMFDEYAKKVENELKGSGIRVSGDYSTDWLNKKVRNAEKMHNNYILVVGEQEQNDGTVSVRNYKTKDQTVESLEEFKSRILEEIKTRSL